LQVSILSMSRLGGTAALIVAACVLIPLWTSVLVRSYAWIVLLQRTGVVNALLQTLGVTSGPLPLLYSDGAVMIAMTHVLLPYMILPIYAALTSIPPELERAALNLGASALASFRAVTWPLSLPGVYAGMVMVFILSLGFYVTPALVGGPRNLTIATLIGQQVSEVLNWPFAGALAGVLLVLTLALVAPFRRFLQLGIGR
jgi:mannopine transport system permease protein